MDNITVIIPAYKPDRTLLDTVRALTEEGFSHILVVDDGGGADYRDLFREIEANPACTLLTHEVNRGKGAALKTAFHYVLDHCPQTVGVVTADADGQHLPRDIRRTAEVMAETGASVLGVRDFSESHVPPRSRAGNRITSFMFRLFFGMKISDTQTGLRAFPTEVLPVLLVAEGDRYEYETNMLYLMDRERLPIREVKISTVYIDENSSSHFRVVRDSLRIYGLQLRYLTGFLAAALLFGGLRLILPFSTVADGVIAGIIAAFIHYKLTALSVFDHCLRPASYWKYMVSAMGFAGVSLGLTALAGLLPEPVSAILPPILWVLAFFWHFRIGHKWVFRLYIYP